MATSVCKECGIEYQSPPSRKRQFCSADCYWSFRHANPFDNDLTVTCTQCKKDFKLCKAKVERSEKLFCSTECMGLYMRASVDVSKMELERMYVDEQWSMEKIARKYDVSASTIRRILDEYEIPRRNRKQWGQASWEHSTEERRRIVGENGKKNVHKMLAKSTPILGAMALSKKRGATDIELIFMDGLQRRGIEFIYQFPVGGKFLCDFYLPAYNVIVECDGTYWHSKPSAQKRDRSKDAYLRKCGYIVMRFDEKEIKRNLKRCIDKALSAKLLT